MSSSRSPYVKPQVLQFDYEVDPGVTLAVTCKDFVAATGQVMQGCRAAVTGACQDTPPS